MIAQNNSAAAAATNSLFETALSLAALTPWGRENILGAREATGAQLAQEQQNRSGVLPMDPWGSLRQISGQEASKNGTGAPPTPVTGGINWTMIGALAALAALLYLVFRKS